MYTHAHTQPAETGWLLIIALLALMSQTYSPAENVWTWLAREIAQVAIILIRHKLASKQILLHSKGPPTLTTASTPNVMHRTIG